MNPTLKIITQNIFLSKRLKKLIKFINEQQADIYCLQEIRGQRVAKKISQKTSYPFLLSESTTAMYRYKMHNLFLTKLKILKSGHLLFLKPRKVRGSSSAGLSFWATLKKDSKKFRIYNCHLSVAGVHPQERLKLLQKIIKHSQKFNGPVIICGDMNTVLPDKPRNIRIVKWFTKTPLTKDELIQFKRERKNEAHDFYALAKKLGFAEAAELHKNTWVLPFTRWELFGLKLDWMLYKGLVKHNHTVGKPIGDHKAIIGEFLIN